MLNVILNIKKYFQISDRTLRDQNEVSTPPIL